MGRGTRQEDGGGPIAIEKSAAHPRCPLIGLFVLPRGGGQIGQYRPSQLGLSAEVADGSHSRLSQCAFKIRSKVASAL